MLIRVAFFVKQAKLASAEFSLAKFALAKLELARLADLVKHAKLAV